MEPTIVRGLALRFIDALVKFEERGAEALGDLVGLFADDASIVNPALEAVGRPRVGREEIRRFWTNYRDVLGRAESRFSHLTTDEHAAGLFWTTRANAAEREEAEGAEGGLHYEGATLLEFDDRGLIATFRAYFDPTEIVREKRGDTERTAADASVVPPPPVGRPGVSYG